MNDHLPSYLSVEVQEKIARVEEVAQWICGQNPGLDPCQGVLQWWTQP